MIIQNIFLIEKMYYEENKTATEIAALFGVHRTTIQNALKKHDEERYYSFRSASGKTNRRSNNSAEDWEKLSLEWIALFKKGLKLKQIAEKYNYDATHVTNILKKYRKEEMKQLKEERKEKNIKKRIEARMEDIRIDAGLKEQQAQNAREMSHRNILTDYAMFVMYLHLYQRYSDGMYKLKSSVKYSMPADMPRTYICQMERDCDRYLKRTS